MRSFDSVLVANRGEIARRVLRTCRSHGLRALTVYTTADADLPYVRESDAAAWIGEGPVSDSYLSFERILDAAARLDAQAIHPGYGLLSENPLFAEAVAQAGLVWIGPSPAAMRAVADKGAARELAQQQGVPVLAGATLADPSPNAIAAEAARVGFPVLIKAIAGGGGRGMRRVERSEDLADAVASARREAGSAFGDDRVLLERYVARARHIEVQIFGDAHGNVIHLGERECSIQRRYQKIIEEAPSPAVSPDLRDRLGAAACAIGQATGYVGAGTVEFLLEPDGSFWFLEVNARLQVEHPVTELVTGLDLVALQLDVAAGQPLPLSQADVQFRGHAIEARLCAEDPMRDNLPGTGQFVRLHLPIGEGVRVDAGFETGNTISPHYDSLIAKIMAHGTTRGTATRRLRRALEQTWAPGPVNNLPLLKQILSTSAWDAADLHTGFLAEHGLPQAPPTNAVHGALAATVAAWAARRTSAITGFRLRGRAAEHDRFTSFGQTIEVTWRTLSSDRVEVTLDDAPPRSITVVHSSGDALAVEVDGIRERWQVATSNGEAIGDGSVIYVHLGDGREAMLSLDPRLPPPVAAASEPGSLMAPTPGTVVSVKVKVGDAVRAGDVLVVLEAMKMEHTVRADHDGSVELIRAEAGAAVSEGELLVRLRADDAV